ncbi:PREDICTED: uncharacterized protein LOC109212859 [Nicotiana attenuata]|uniref:uncharacterized protein LOC109212859 n=1 Tax=Nicotiana attenuata TaxID=49451 RepID=UPI000904F7B8|nr:PREDICTED: uncharacterized protein LOC109212859 [Nicotiana attenuata]
MFKVVKRLKLLKKGLKALNTQAFNNIVTETNKDRTNLKKAQEQLQRRPLNMEYQQAEVKAYQKFRKSSYLAEVYLQQRSKATWIRLGDDNTKYFHSVIKHRKLKQAVTQIKDSSGRTTNDRVKTFSSIIRKGSRLSEPQQDKLMQPFLGREVKQAMFQIDSNKSPGPNGFGSDFYKATRPIVGGDITEAKLEFFQNGRLLRQINTTNIALIPNVEAPETWIMICVSTAKFTVKVNGEGHGYFAGKRGPRQGDPMSPLLFVLVMEYLSRTLSIISRLPDFRFHPMYKEIKLTHLIFADDPMIFCKGNTSYVNRVMEALDHFSKVSGLIANMEKSNIFVAGVGDDIKKHNC